ncbi:hypothetical protein N7495_003204 [Penicillium taxi]|uniref:uncharacterized protein n=1 Tax=Penicillium taxi TaxID=168475 RepID=UPI002544DF61|nr:uncharacterized protein N7495_003204 [Penicillium taxi]KAJ5902676.1 hypothetical protein N7495_003204 [Penicillium taxi]
MEDSGHSNPHKASCTLPPEKVFSIQLGSEVFRLSGASIASDAPSYFSRFFEEQLRCTKAANVRTLYIDRDPETFREIARHLQGYHVRPRDGAQFVKLFADSQFYTLPRLMSQLFESEIFIEIGDRHFRIARDIFSGPGDSPNFFSLGFGAFFASPDEVFPGLERKGLLRPPAIVPASVPSRSADTFAELLHILRGYPLDIRNEFHRGELLRDCRYFHLRGLEQKLIPYKIVVNPFNQQSEITIRLEDVKPSGILVTPKIVASGSVVGGTVMYARPFTDDNASHLILQISGESTLIDPKDLTANFIGQTKTRMASLINFMGKKMDIPESQIRGLPLRFRLGLETDLTIDGKGDHPLESTLRAGPGTNENLPPVKRQRVEATEDGPWVVRTGQWRLHLLAQANDTYEVILCAVKLDIYTSQRTRVQARDFI